MSGGISYALKVITERIPPQILNRVFVVQKYGRHFNEVSVESIIFDKVVAHTVIRDCSLRGHNEATIPLSMDWIERYEEPPRTIIAIPPIARQMLPIISVLSGQLANQLGGALVIEQVFSIPGIGLYLINAVNTRDYPVAQSSVVFLSILFSLIVLLTDLGYAAVDPIIRAQFVQGGTKKKKRKEENG